MEVTIKIYGISWVNYFSETDTETCAELDLYKIDTRKKRNTEGTQSLE